jgi:hypothetical protein
MPARGPIVLTEDEAELVLDMLGRPSEDDSTLVTQMRGKFLEFLKVCAWNEVGFQAFFSCNNTESPRRHNTKHDV